MNKKEVKQILNLNKKFYQSIAKDFSQTRQAPWMGWGRVAEILRKENKEKPTSKGVKILDLGCGNGRFFGFIDSKIPNIKYTGLDINNDLLQEAKNKYGKRYKNAKFIKKDVLKKIEKIKNKYNIVVAFGLAHHIPDKNFRKKWFSQLPKLLDINNGCKSFLVLTFWEFEEKPGDYLIGWDKRKGTTRFCHKYSKKEIDELIKMYKKLGLEIVDDYFSDSRNHYLIFGNI